MIAKFKKNNYTYCLEKTGKVVQSNWGFNPNHEYSATHRKTFNTIEEAQKYFRQKFLEKKRQGYTEVTGG